ncbi:hypothetical protein Glove_103g65 [Diversispora epigaea]|uniref:Uncharacterized protein n=1 Tax=Diversispora epigaea TaxID=1348612 RepID=A0A397J7U5_9GLOM|nr:hypothetical protein Glove_103g65 [Diversispora epigaea]
MQSELDLLKQENARLMTRIAELEQRETENAELKAKVIKLEHDIEEIKKQTLIYRIHLLKVPQTNSQYNYCSIYLYSSVQAKSPEDKKVDDFLDLTYNDKKIEQGIIQEVILFIQKGKPLTSSNSISKTQSTNIKVNDDESGQELAQLFSDAEITEGKTIEAKHMLVYL